MIFSADDYENLQVLFTCAPPNHPKQRGTFPAYAGYRPNVVEIPNGDGKKDAEKRFLHVAPKYNPPAWAVAYLARAHYEACRVAEALGVPAEFYPRAADGTLRVLDYPPGAGTEEHTDFDLFTILCWRSTPADLERDWDPCDAGPGERSPRDDAEALSPGLHIGEIGELAGLGPATPHRVPARPYAQQSIVYFAIPDHAARLPSRNRWCERRECYDDIPGPTVREWLAERLARSRVTR